MTKEQQYAELTKMIHAYTKEHTKSAESARNALIKEGIYDKNGRLKKKFDETLDCGSEAT